MPPRLERRHAELPRGLHLGSRVETVAFRHNYWPLTLQCAPSESTNCASKPPKSCFVGDILNCTPFAVISWWNLSRSGTLKPSSTAPARFLSDAGCNARTVSPV